MKYNTYPIHSSVAGFLLRYRPMYYALPLVRIEEEGEGILDSYPNLKLTTTWRHCEQSLVRCSNHARDMFFAFWPPNGGLLDVSLYDHGFKQKVKCDNVQALRANNIAGSHYASDLHNLRGWTR